jgi:transposase
VALLREFYPGFLAAFADGSATNLASRQARAILALAPTPAAGARLSQTRIATALRRAGRKRGIDTLTAHIHHTLRIAQLRQPARVETAMGHQVSALLATLTTECANAEHLSAAATEAFTQHPDHHIITSFPGLADLTGDRVLAEIGDDRTRFTDARALKAYAGSAPVTRASGRSLSITRRRIKNDRLNAVGFLWAFATLPRPGPPKDHYDRRRAHGDRHAGALRHLFNRMLGQLYHCLQTRQTYDPIKAFGAPTTTTHQATT